MKSTTVLFMEYLDTEEQLSEPDLCQIRGCYFTDTTKMMIGRTAGVDMTAAVLKTCVIDTVVEVATGCQKKSRTAANVGASSKPVGRWWYQRIGTLLQG